MRRWTVPILALVLAGCSHGSHTSSPTSWNGIGTMVNADYICRQYVTGPYVSAETTTVADFRKTTIGTRGPAQLHRFPRLPASAEAAWCWTGKPGAYNVYEVTSGGEVQQVVSHMGSVAPGDAHGPPFVP